MTRQPLDGAQMDLAHSLVPPKAGAEQVLRAFAVLTGAAAAVSCRFADVMDVGSDLSEHEQEYWGELTHLLLRLADVHTFGADGTLYEVEEALGTALEAVRHVLPREENP